MALGKSIQIYLSDGTVNGIRHGQITNWTGQAISCSRARFADLKDWPEIKRPGVYLLFGLDEESGADAAYIGEAEHVLDRLTAHLSGKEFWSEVIVFTSKDDYLTKAHVKFLEARLVQQAGQAGRYQLKNTVNPALPSLSKADRDAMEDYAQNIRTLIGVLGHRILEPKVAAKASVALHSVPSANVAQHVAAPVKAGELQTQFSLKVSGLAASALRTDEGIVVLAGSSFAGSAQPSLSSGYLAMRETLISQNVVVPANGQSNFQFAKDHVFPSPSQAAAVIVGYPVNGREVWKTPDGQTWRSVEEKSFSATN
ncbi:MAG: GIY-YIG nuclease family protein [Pseudomonadota bacterium]|jgi:hypothetical protein